MSFDPPTKWLEVVAQLYPSLKFKLAWNEPDTSDRAGALLAANGEVIQMITADSFQNPRCSAVQKVVAVLNVPSRKREYASAGLAPVGDKRQRVTNVVELALAEDRAQGLMVTVNGVEFRAVDSASA